MFQNMGDMMKQAQALQEQMKEMQEQVAKAKVTGESGAGMVKVEMNGRHDVTRVELDPSLMQEDKEILEDLLAAAVNDAVRRVEQNNQEQMRAMASKMGMPAGTDFKMPF